MSNNSYNFYPRLDGLNQIEADSILTNDLSTTTLMATSFKTNLIQSINNTNNLTLEALTSGQVIIKSNGVNIAIFDTSNNLITFNNRVSQIRSDTSVSYGPNCLLTPTYVAGTSGLLLTAFGAGALQRNTTGNYNTAFGNGALPNLTTGSNNVGLGAGAGQNITSGSGHMCIGLQACYSTTTSTDNIGIGTQAGSGYTTGSGNVAIGTRSGLFSSTYGASPNNTSIGNEAGQASGIMTSITSIGRRANYLNVGGWSNSTAIGALSQTTANNQIQLGYSGQFTSTDAISIGKTTIPIGKCDIEGSTNVNGILSIKNGNNLQIYNATNSNSLNLFVNSNDYYFNNTSSTGTITFQVNSFTLLSITSSLIASNVAISCPTPTVGDDSLNVATTEFVKTAFNNFLNNSNAWTSSNSFNVNLPTSTLTPSSNSQLTTKLYVDNKVATTISGVALLAGNNTFTGITNVFNSSVSFGTQAPSTFFAPTLGSNLCNKTYVDKNALAPPTKLITFQEDFLTSTGGMPLGSFAYSGTGGSSQSFGTTSSHPGIITMTNNRTVYNLTTIESWFPKQIKWIVRTTTALNTFNWYAGTYQGVSNYTNSAFIGHTSGTTTFFASVNNTTFNNFNLVSWAQNKWYEMTLDFNNPSITFTIQDLTTPGDPESITLTSVGFDFNRTNIFAFAQVSVAGTNICEVDYCSLSYQSDRV